MTGPVLLLDVDGVVNALPRTQADLAAWPRWEQGTAVAGGRSWPIRFAPAVVDQLRAWHESAAVELRWLTTWGHDANRGLHTLLGLPELAVAGTYDDGAGDGGADDDGAADDGAADDDPGAATSTAATSHAAVAPAAPDPLSGRWWKYDAVRRLLQREPGRAVIWVDDELHPAGSPFRSWAAAQDRVTPVGPDPRTGLTRRDLDEIAVLLG